MAQNAIDLAHIMAHLRFKSCVLSNDRNEFNHYENPTGKTDITGRGELDALPQHDTHAP